MIFWNLIDLSFENNNYNIDGGIDIYEDLTKLKQVGISLYYHIIISLMIQFILILEN